MSSTSSYLRLSIKPLSSVAFHLLLSTHIGTASLQECPFPSKNLNRFDKGSDKILQDLRCAAMLAPPLNTGVPLPFNRASAFALGVIIVALFLSG